MHLQVKMVQNGTKKVFRSKQITIKVSLMLLDVKIRRERYYCKQTSEKRCAYLALKNLKIRRKGGNKWLKSNKGSTTDIFGSSSAKTNLCVMSLAVEMDQLRSALHI